jgi:hypothetical protein
MLLVHKDFTIHAMLYSRCRTCDAWIYKKFNPLIIEINNPEINNSIVLFTRNIDERFEKI